MKKIKPVKTLWKSMQAGMKSSHGDIDWKIGEWQMGDKNPVRCAEGGFHASRRVIDAMSFVSCGVLALVEVSGDSDVQKDKEAWRNMRIVKAYEWDKTASVRLSIYAAEKCIAIYEKEYPNDDRPRKAIEAAVAWLKNPCEETESAAWSAERSAVSAVSAARSAARSAAWSAESAAWSAESAAWSAARSAVSAVSAAWSAARSAVSAESAAWSAESAAWSAESAAWSAAFEQALDETEEFIISKIIPTLKEYAT